MTTMEKVARAVASPTPLDDRTQKAVRGYLRDYDTKTLLRIAMGLEQIRKDQCLSLEQARERWDVN